MTIFEIISIFIAGVSAIAAIISAISSIKTREEFIKFRNTIDIKQSTKGNNNVQSIGDLNNGR